MVDAKRRQIVKIKRLDEDQRLIFGEVYAPDTLDTYGEFVTAADLELLAHRFAQLNLGEVIDTNHDNIANGSFPVESFLARAGDPDFTRGAWVLGVKVPDDHIWLQIKKGELNGFSFEALVRPVDCLITVKKQRDLVGKTELHDDHDHMIFIELSDQGRVIQGRTTTELDANGELHDHKITRASVTERGGGNRHNHRFFL